jgi:hypothetical protein
MTAGYVSTILRAWSRRDQSALDRLTPMMRDWSTDKAWLYRELTGGTGDGF